MHTLYQQMAGDTLAETLTRLESDIKARPTDADLRAAFVQLLCLAGNWQRARTQLKSWLALKPQAKPAVTLLEQAIDGELERQQVMAGQAAPRMPEQAWPWLAHLVSALEADSRGDLAAAQALREQALDAAAANPGQLRASDEDHAFDWLMDGDARLGPVCELIVNGHYFWAPFSAIAEIECLAPSGVVDLVWRHARVCLVDGTEQVCQIPARYPVSADTADRFLLGRETHWQPRDSEGSQCIGQGQKVLLNADNAFPFLTLEHLTFTASEPAHE